MCASEEFSKSCRVTTKKIVQPVGETNDSAGFFISFRGISFLSGGA